MKPIEYICSNTECGNVWEDTDLESICSICGANGERKPPAPDGELKPIRP
jgi:hypothetical protein